MCIQRQLHTPPPNIRSISPCPIRSKSSGTEICPAMKPSRRTCVPVGALIAEEANVSIGTVSHVINSTAVVRPKLKLRVLETIRNPGFQPSAVAQGMRRNRLRMLGTIVPDITNPFFPGFGDIYRPSIFLASPSRSTWLSWSISPPPRGSQFIRSSRDCLARILRLPLRRISRRSPLGPFPTCVRSQGKLGCGPPNAGSKSA